MAEKLILTEQSFTTVYLESVGCFLMDVDAPSETLVVGQEYVVRFDGVDYACICFDAGAVLANTVGLGNGAPLNLPGNGEPFVLQWTAGEDQSTVFCFADTAATAHTIAISEKTEDVKILLRDYAGTAQEYDLPQRLRVDTADGGATEFVHESLVAEPVETTVAPDFSGGDMTVTPEAGQTFSKVTVQVPENLAPDNIAQGVAIAGIVGTAQAGGKDVKISVGSFTGNDGSLMVYHNLGVVPDVFVAYCTGAYTLSGTSKLSSPVAIGVSRAFKDRYGVETSRYGLMPSSSSSVVTEKTTLYGIDDDGNTRWIMDATATKITLGSSYVTTFSQKYEWIAIGGLV